jgi:hypothetical protein
MKPTQENILRLIQENKPKKELLSVQKIDLKRDKISSYAQDAEKIYWNIKKAAKQDLVSTAQMIQNDRKKVKKVLNETQDDYTKFLKDLKALGINPSEVKQSRQFETSIKETSDWDKRLLDLASKIEKFKV